MNLAPDNGKTDFIYSALEIIDRIFSVLDVLFNFNLLTENYWIVQTERQLINSLLIVIYCCNDLNVSWIKYELQRI